MLKLAKLPERFNVVWQWFWLHGPSFIGMARVYPNGDFSRARYYLLLNRVDAEVGDAQSVIEETHENVLKGLDVLRDPRF